MSIRDLALRQSRSGDVWRGGASVLVFGMGFLHPRFPSRRDLLPPLLLPVERLSFVGNVVRVSFLLECQSTRTHHPRREEEEEGVNVDTFFVQARKVVSTGESLLLPVQTPLAVVVGVPQQR